MKIDYILTRKQITAVPVFFILAMVLSMSISENEISLLIVCSYMMLVASIFTTAPFGYCDGKNRGFLLLLPATVKDRVVGRFLYGLSYIVLLGLVCSVLIGGYRLLGLEVTGWMPAAVLCELAVGTVIVSLELLFFYLFGEGKGNWQYLSNFMRVAPGMVMFFVICYLSDKIDDAAGLGMETDPDLMASRLMLAGVIAVVLSLVLTAVAAAVCVKVIEKRDYA